jgi:hypothetical protein
MRRLFLCLVTVSGLGAMLAAVQIAPRQVAPAIAQAIGAIWTIPRTGGAMTRLTHDAGFDIEPTWSPDGEHIAYVNSPRFGAGDLRIVTMQTAYPDSPGILRVGQGTAAATVVPVTPPANWDVFIPNTGLPRALDP